MTEDLHTWRIDRQRAGQREPRRRKRLLAPGVIGVRLVVVVFMGTRRKPTSQPGPVAEPVRVAAAAQRDTDGPPPVLSASGHIITTCAS